MVRFHFKLGSKVKQIDLQAAAVWVAIGSDGSKQKQEQKEFQ